MSKADETTPPPIPDAAKTPPPRSAMVIPTADVARPREVTKQWDLGAPPTREISVGDGNVAVTVASAAPAPDIEVDVAIETPSEPNRSSAAGTLEHVAEAGPGTEPETLAPLSETPTAPLPIEKKSGDTGEIDIAEVAVTEVGVSGPDATDGAYPKTPPPIPATRPEPVRAPPIPIGAIDPAMRGGRGDSGDSGDPGEKESWVEPLSERPRSKRAKPWYEEVFDEDYLRTLPFMTAEQTLREANFIYDCLMPPLGGDVLDVACGYGRHAIELAQRGLKITGIDFSLPLLIRAADEAQRRTLAVDFVHADMRELSFDNQFHGAYCMLTSFGYFDEETNLKVASGIYRALKPGGKLLLETLNRDYIVADLPTRVWWEGDGCVVLEEVDFNFHTSRVTIRRSIVFQDGRQIEQDISIRAYSLHEIGRLMRQAGFRVTEVSGSLATRGRFFGATSRNLLVVCERPPV